VVHLGDRHFRAVVPFRRRRFALEPARVGQHDAWLVPPHTDTSAAWSSPRFVGRASELETLRQASARAEQRRGQIVGVVGEAGVGKSRLVPEGVRRLSGWLVLSSGGAPYATNTPYFPIVDTKTLRDRGTSAAVEVRESRPIFAGRRRYPDSSCLLLDLLGVLPSDDAFRASIPQRPPTPQGHHGVPRRELCVRSV
jgi:hypothetical protein